MHGKTGQALALVSLFFQPISSMLAVQAPGPLSPEGERESFELADTQLTIELVAAEPKILSPVAICWDAQQRLFVAEMIDYPTGPGSGQIRLLTDRDQNGLYETATVFADALPFPNSVLPWKDGILVTAAPDIWFLKDTNGDGRADEKRKIWTGFAQGNQQLRANGLLWGLDHWVYGANGRSDGEVRRPGDSISNAISIRRRDFRFQPDRRQFEAITGYSQFGLARDDWGNRFLSWNTIPIRQVILEMAYLSRSPHLSAPEPVLDISPPDDPQKVFAISPSPTVFNQEPAGYFNASCGLTIFRGDHLGSEYYGNAFVAEPLRNLVHRRVLKSHGITFLAERPESTCEFLASTDPWFHPVNLATGPDGALYVVDFYRQYVEHPAYAPEMVRSQVAWRSGAEHGRIWRIKHQERTGSRPGPLVFSSASRSSGLVKQLDHPNGWRRDTAHRLLLEGRDRSAIPALKRIIAKAASTQPVARVHALWILEGLNALDEASILRGLGDPDARVRETAVRVAELGASSLIARPGDRISKIERALRHLVQDPHHRVRFQLALTLGAFNHRLEPLLTLARSDITNPWIDFAILSSLADQTWPFLRQLVGNDSRWLTAPSQSQIRFLTESAKLVAVRNDPKQQTGLFELIQTTLPDRGFLSLLEGFSQGLSELNQSWWAFPPAAQRRMELLSKVIALAEAEGEPVQNRILAVGILSRSPPSSAAKPLVRLLAAPTSPEVQLAAAQALFARNEIDKIATVFAQWNQYTPSIRRQVLSSALRSKPGVEALLDALEKGRISSSELDTVTQQALRKFDETEIRSRLEKFFRSAAAADRGGILDQYQIALQLEGNRSRGAAVYAKACISCHAVQGKGGGIGPDLSVGAGRSPGKLLADIIDPNREVSPDYLSYIIRTKQDQVVSGLIVRETGDRLVLRQPEQPDTTIFRADILELRPAAQSLMPEGLEHVISPQEMADLLEFLRNPEKAILPPH